MSSQANGLHVHTDMPASTYTRTTTSPPSGSGTDKAIFSGGQSDKFDASVHGKASATYSPATAPTLPPFPSTTEVRRDLANRWITSHPGVMHNPLELPRIRGRWYWLEPADRRRAAALGYNDPIQATMARSRRELGRDVDSDTPNVIFVPHRPHLNPNEQPEGEGYWSYMTAFEPGSARALAWEHLGGKEEYGFGNVRFPHARDVWALRQRLRAEGRTDPELEDVDIAWVEDSFIPSPYTDAPPTHRPSMVATRQIDPEVVDPAPPHLPHDPTNGGAHDQTGSPDLHTWRTIQIGGRNYTLDVSTAIIGRPEPHKFEIVGPKGWRRFEKAGEMDWNNVAHLTRLNGWRDQALNRSGWPRKRDEERESYTDEEKLWVFNIVAANGGKPPSSHRLRDVAVEFNEKFNAQRSASAMSSLAARLSKMHAEHNGQFAPGKKRGQAKKEEAEKKRKERESSADGAPKPKRMRKQPPKKMITVQAVVEAEEPGNEKSGGTMMVPPAPVKPKDKKDGDGDVAMSGVEQSGADNGKKRKRSGS